MSRSFLETGDSKKPRQLSLYQALNIYDFTKATSLLDSGAEITDSIIIEYIDENPEIEKYLLEELISRNEGDNEKHFYWALQLADIKIIDYFLKKNPNLIQNPNQESDKEVHENILHLLFNSTAHSLIEEKKATLEYLLESQWSGQLDVNLKHDDTSPLEIAAGIDDEFTVAIMLLKSNVRINSDTLNDLLTRVDKPTIDLINSIVEHRSFVTSQSPLENPKELKRILDSLPLITEDHDKLIRLCQEGYNPKLMEYQIKNIPIKNLERKLCEDYIHELKEAGLTPEDEESTKVSRETPLSAAASHGHVELVRLLLEKGSDPNILFKAGSSSILYDVCLSANTIFMDTLDRYNYEYRGEELSNLELQLKPYLTIADLLIGKGASIYDEYWQDYQKEHDGRSTPIDLLYNMSSIIGDEYQDLAYVLSAIKDVKIIKLETQAMESELKIATLEAEAAEKDDFITKLENCAVESELKAATLEVEAAEKNDLIAELLNRIAALEGGAEKKIKREEISEVELPSGIAVSIKGLVKRTADEMEGGAIDKVTEATVKRLKEGPENHRGHK